MNILYFGIGVVVVAAAGIGFTRFNQKILRKSLTDLNTSNAPAGIKEAGTYLYIVNSVQNGISMWWFAMGAVILLAILLAKVLGFI